MPDSGIQEPESRRTRRTTVALLGAVGVGVLAALLGTSDRAIAGHDGTNIFHLGETNIATAGTTLVADVPAEAFTVDTSSGDAGRFQSGSGRGVLGISTSGTGVTGGSNDGSAGTFGSQNGDGVEGFSNGAGRGGVFHSETGNGLEAASTGAIAVLGFSDSGHGGVFTSRTNEGVAGGSDSGTGGSFGSQNGDGVLGQSEGGGAGGRFRSVSGPGVDTSSQTGLALDVAGKARFSSAGAGTIPVGQNSTFVANTAVTAKSHISVTLASDPGGRKLSWVAKAPGSGFTVNAPGPANARPATAFTYLIVEFV